MTEVVERLDQDLRQCMMCFVVSVLLKESLK